MTPETVDIAAELYSAAKWLGGGLVGLIVWFLKKEINQNNAALERKADKEQVQGMLEQAQRDNEGLKMELKELRDRRDVDLERIERANAERFAAFSESMRDRISTMERNVDGKLDMLNSAMGDKLDTVLRMMDGLRKE